MQIPLWEADFNFVFPEDFIESKAHLTTAHLKGVDLGVIGPKGESEEE